MYKRFIAFMAVLWSFFPGTAKAAPPALQQINNDDFNPSWVSHEPGSKTIVVYGASAGAGSMGGSLDIARLTASDNGVSNSYSFAWVTGVNTAVDEYTMLACPNGSFCSGKALYRTALGAISKCDLVGDAMSGCSNLPSFVAKGENLGLTTTKIIATKNSDNRLYLVDPITGASTPMSANCSPSGKVSLAAGGLAGGFLYLSSNRAGAIGSNDLFRITWNGDCTGSAVNLMDAGYFKSASPLTDDASINTVGPDFGAVDPLSGAVYYRDWNTGFPFVAKKEKLCDDGFIEGLDEPGGEECDGAAMDVYGAVPNHDKWRLNAQTCLTIGGFTGGTLKCHPKGHPFECKFDTSSCTLAASCGDGVKNASESCDGSDLGGASCTSVPGGFSGGTLACTGACTFSTSGCYKCGDGVINPGEVCDGASFGGATCASIKGPGWTGALTCSSCASVDSSACVAPPPSCGDLTCNGSETCANCPGDCGACAPVCGDSIKNGSDSCDGSDLGGASCASVPGGFSGGTLACSGSCTFSTSGCYKCGDGVINPGEVCDGASFGGATCASIKGPGWTGALTCSTCSSIVSSSCVPPAPVCGNGVKELGEECDPPDVGSCNVLGEGYTGTPSCNASCKLVYDDCTAPATCGNGTLDAGEQCDGAVPAGKTCESVLGTGWTGSLACSSCILNKSGCSFDWGIKNLSGACYMSGIFNQTIVFTGGPCTADYLPIGALTPTKLKWTAKSSTQITLAVAHAGEWTKVNVPYGVDHDEVVDNGNKYEIIGGGESLGVGGTIYSQKWITPEVWRSTCTEGYITFSATASGEPASGLNVDGTPGKLPSGYGVEINLTTNSTNKGPWLLSGGTGGTGGDAGAGGEGGAGTGGNAGTGSTGGAGQGGTGVGGAPPAINGDPGDGGGTCSFAYSSERNSSIALMFGAALALMASRRRNRG